MNSSNNWVIERIEMKLVNLKNQFTMLAYWFSILILSCTFFPACLLFFLFHTKLMSCFITFPWLNIFVIKFNHNSEIRMVNSFICLRLLWCRIFGTWCKGFVAWDWVLSVVLDLNPRIYFLGLDLRQDKINHCPRIYNQIF